MFEGSLVESRGRAMSRAQRWSAMGSAAVQMMVAVQVVVVPLMRPQTLKILSAAPHLTAPPLPVRTPDPVRLTPSNVSSAGPRVPSTPESSSSGTRFFSLTPGMPAEDGPPGPIGPITVSGGPGPMLSLGTGNGPVVTVAHPARVGPLNISHLSEGMLLSPIRAAYPQIAVLTKTQGTVVVEAVISKAGTIESAHAISGPPMLRQAALDAVEAARYRPYLLSGEPVEVQTTVTVVFRLGE
jgi:protein TonB